MIKGFLYFITLLLALWLAQGFAAFLVEMWPIIKWAILVGAAAYLFKNLGKRPEPKPTDGGDA